MAERYQLAKNKGLEGVVVCDTAISSIQGLTLTYRGYAIEDLADNASFCEVAHLLWKGHLPTSAELNVFMRLWLKNMQLNDAEKEFLRVMAKNFAPNAHPMHFLRTAVSALAHDDESRDDQGEKVNTERAVKIAAKVASIVAAFHRLRNNEEILDVNFDKKVSWNFLNMLFGVEPSQDYVDVFNTCLILHADHELNCSAFSARVTASSLSDLYSAVTSAIGTLKGPLHGGANEAVILMLQEIGSLDKVDHFVDQAIVTKKKIMGIGHRIYKNGDPRAHILKKMSKKLCDETGHDEWFAMSERIETLMAEKKSLTPNVDFYSATLYYAMGIPIDLFTPIFAMSRVAGWCAHALEQWKVNRIYRPISDYAGTDGKQWVPINDR